VSVVNYCFLQIASEFADTRLAEALHQNATTSRSVLAGQR